MTHTLLILLLIVFQAQAPQQSKSAKEYFDSAVVRLQKEDLDGTIADLTKAIELSPNYVDAFFIRGQCLFLKGDRDRALLDYDKVLDLAPLQITREQLNSIQNRPPSTSIVEFLGLSVRISKELCQI